MSQNFLTTANLFKKKKKICLYKAILELPETCQKDFCFNEYEWKKSVVNYKLHNILE